MAKSTSGPQIWHKIIDAFHRKKLKYVLVGAGALVIHGLPRSTLDIDIYIPATKNYLIKLFAIAGSLGLSSKQKTILGIAHLPRLFVNQWLCFSYEGQDILDIFLAPEHEFNKLYKNSERKKDKTLTVQVASLNDLEKMKKAAGRAIDIVDLKLIAEAKKYQKK